MHTIIFQHQTHSVPEILSQAQLDAVCHVDSLGHPHDILTISDHHSIIDSIVLTLTLKFFDCKKIWWRWPMQHRDPSFNKKRINMNMKANAQKGLVAGKNVCFCSKLKTIKFLWKFFNFLQFQKVWSDNGARSGLVSLVNLDKRTSSTFLSQTLVFTFKTQQKLYSDKNDTFVRGKKVSVKSFRDTYFRDLSLKLLMAKQEHFRTVWLRKT